MRKREKSKPDEEVKNRNQYWYNIFPETLHRGTQARKDREIRKMQKIGVGGNKRRKVGAE